jgi:hypothetical protein
MPDAHAARETISRCQARPRAARPGYREDMLCASSASTTVPFHGIEMPVCRIHDASYTRWGDEAEAHASLHWGWIPPEAFRDDETELEPQLTPTGA